MSETTGHTEAAATQSSPEPPSSSRCSARSPAAFPETAGGLESELGQGPQGTRSFDPDAARGRARTTAISPAVGTRS